MVKKNNNQHYSIEFAARVLRPSLSLSWRQHWKRGKSSTAFTLYLLLFLLSPFAAAVRVQAQAEYPDQESAVGETVKALNAAGDADVDDSQVLSVVKNNSNTNLNVWVEVTNVWYYNVVPNGDSFTLAGDPIEYSVTGDIDFSDFDKQFTISFTTPANECSSNCEVKEDFPRILSENQYNELFATDPAVAPEAPVIPPGGATTGINYVEYGEAGSSGSNGALFVPPTPGRQGKEGPDITWINQDGGTTPDGKYAGSVDIPRETVGLGVYTGSVGGKGGTGGSSYVSPFSGREGGQGGAGGNVDFTNKAQIRVLSNEDDTPITLKGWQGQAWGESGGAGIVAFSIGGQGGDGGDGQLAPVAGDGGEGAGAGNVIVTNLADILTGGGEDGSEKGSSSAFGIYAFSGGGQGGEGGDQSGIWGWPGDGGGTTDGGDVTITNGDNESSPTIQTFGDYSHVLNALSVGGAGGDSGSSTTLFSGSAFGGSGGNAGKLEISNYGTLTSLGDFSRGIQAQSAGGAGGAGSTAIGLVALAGQGGAGGDAQPVTVENSGVIFTAGIQSDGIFAQSVGGSGGSGGDAAGLVSLGGSGGPGGKGADVVVTNRGAITASANYSDTDLTAALNDINNSLYASLDLENTGDIEDPDDKKDAENRNADKVAAALAEAEEIYSGLYTGGRGIFAQSVGGSGGDGGMAVGQIAIGGSGGDGNTSGDVTVTNQGSIDTYGLGATGIYAQSVGGGGGNGGSSTAGGLFVSVAIGGSGGTGNDAGQVSIFLEGSDENPASTITTQGNNSLGLFAQSVGGGGGNGGGAFAASIGVGASVSTSVGGSGAAAGDGGIVNVNRSQGSSEILTQGDYSTGIFLQSIGGGGGNGGYATSVAGAFEGAAISTAIGGTGSGGGNGGLVVLGNIVQPDIEVIDNEEVDVYNFELSDLTDGYSGSIATEGEYSPAFIAQSVGGGGGNGGSSTAASLAVGSAVAVGISTSLAGEGAMGGIGGTVAVGLGDVSITTQEQFSPGVLAQSVGGSGGNGGDSKSLSLTLSTGAAVSVSTGMGGDAGAGSEGGDVLFATGEGTVSTSGNNSTGITVQSIGGGGGNGGSNISASLAGGGIGAAGVAVGIGGTGGGGAESGQVLTDIGLDVSTEGNESPGVIIQAVGGGGGNGGYNVSASVAAGGTGAGAVSVGLGGDGGTAADGGIVDAKFSGEVSTTGHQSSGVIVQSVGGGGGNGGFNVSASFAGAGVGAAGISVGLGGSGAGGGNGGVVSAVIGDENETPDIVTTGDNSSGIVAQALGGGGGNGGFNVSASLAGAGTAAAAVGVGLGGSGGGGGDGGEVMLVSNNNVYTGAYDVNSGLVDSSGEETDRTGDNSPGIVAQSIGGGGGNGGFNVTGTISGAGAASASAGVGLGGSGGKGGDATESVSLDATGNVQTLGNSSTGVIAQSVGGGGGNGGFNVTASLAGAGTGALGVSVGIGGQGGDGGDATGIVTSSYIGDLSTDGDSSAGVFAQSLGGGGGNGGFNISGTISGAGSISGAVSVGLGGSGGGGGHSGAEVDPVATPDVYSRVLDGVGNAIDASECDPDAECVVEKTELTADILKGNSKVVVSSYVAGSVKTLGKDSSGTVAQSVGGGGGNGGFDVTGSISGAGTGSLGVSVGLGGSGGKGGHSSGVEQFIAADINTSGSNSSGIFTQSLGGGGGNGGFNVTGSISGAGSNSGAIGVGLGGSGGGGGTSGKATTVVNKLVDDSGDYSSSDETNLLVIQTSGDDSSGVVTQSLGGGGGNGGFNVTGSISGAGSNSAAVSVGIGGSGGGGGDAGLDVEGVVVDSDVTADISTDGVGSKGVVAQAIGGGGGNGGFTVAAGISAAGSNSGAINVGIGGSGGDGGNAAGVKNEFTGSIATKKADSTAVLAQSVGGGGGNGGFTVAAGISGSGKAGGTASVGIGGSGGGGGDAGDVTNTVNASITTGDTSDSESGANSDGVVAQSLGGGGGNGGFSVAGGLNLSSNGAGSVAVGFGGSGGEGGNAGDVINSYKGELITYGPTSTGVLAQSVGGGGGNGGFNVSGAVAISASSNAAAAAIGVGGFGGGGGDSGDVTNTVIGRIQTLGDNPDPEDTDTPFSLSGGVITQSLGGGGGNGGFNVSGEITGSSKSTGGLAFGLGGFGGDGGDSNSAFSKLMGSVQTSGDYASAIATQSVGGSGGRGGFNVAGSLSLSKESSGSVGIGIGGFGGGGGDVLGIVTSFVESDLTNETFGNYSPVVFAQSLGGGGGNGGFNVSGSASLSGKSGASVAVGVGGFGGDGGNANEVLVDVIADLRSVGRSSDGLVAQSVGGAGGNGATNVSGTLAITTSGKDSSKTTSASIGVGGFGGGGGDAKTVDVDFSGSIYAVPDIKSVANEDIELGIPGLTLVIPQAPTEYGSNGLVAQSVGGSGGNGGLNVSGGLSYAAKDAEGNALMIGVGGFGGQGGNAGDVILDIGGEDVLDIRAYGPGRSAVNASSIGGAGGNGGLNISGGITSDSPLIFGIGGFGGDGGFSKDVTVNVNSNLYTDYDSYLGDLSDLTADLIRSGGFSEEISAGLLAQSIGGGGGNGGLNVSGGIAISKDDNSLPSLMFGLGGFGGEGNISGIVDVEHNGEISVTGSYTHGILAQSIAGGGGNGGLNITGLLTPAFGVSEENSGKTDLSLVAGIGGFAGSGANSEAVTVYSSRDTDPDSQSGISAYGNYSRGIFAQSIGGGGGVGGASGTFVGGRNTSPLMLGIGGFGGGGGNSGIVEIYRGSEDQSAGQIQTFGIGAIGIEASSIGGGGGDAGWNIALGISKSIGGSANDGKGTADGDSRPTPTYEGIDDSVFTNFNSVLDELEGRQSSDSQDSSDANKSSSFAAQILIGGDGGEAGDGNTASVENYSSISTKGKDSHGILAQSIGGGGGNASVNVGITYQKGYDSSKGFNLAVGGAPGNGGLGKAATVNHVGDIETDGFMSYGILAQSIGGGGGNVGFEMASSFGDKAGKISLSIGRRGGTGGNSGVVSLSSLGNIVTLGDSSFGLLAQSIGNGGGNSGSISVSGTLPPNADQSDAPDRGATVSVGLEGGEGGFADEVTLISAGSIATFGNDSHAIFAQSIGGGGGNAGSASADPSGGSIQALVIGGEGGIGGYSSKVEVSNDSIVSTRGTNSLGIFAQSIGGSGGSGGAASINPTFYVTKVKSGESIQVSIGGKGGTGNYSGDVNVTNSGSIFTFSENADDDDLKLASHAILAQSIGGGGGASGSSLNLTLNGDTTNSRNINVAVGGDGGEGGYAGKVTVLNSAFLQTSSDNSVGIFAQSIGGGGGNSDNVAVINNGSAKSDSTSTKLYSLAWGGKGGAGGYSEDVIVRNQAGSSIVTTGDKAYGILAMSVGGGGGSGSTTIAANYSKGSDAQTVDAVELSIGGDGGEGGRSGSVNVTNDGFITTFGKDAHAIIAQSVAGGGGSGGVSIAANPGSISDVPYNLTAALGGSGGTGNIADDVNVFNTSEAVITTYGDGAYGIYAQSVGGGGGSGGLALVLSKSLLNKPLSIPSLTNIAAGGSGGAGGGGGDVLVENNGLIRSYGDNSYGIYAQSIGAGGGDVGFSLSSPVWTAVDYSVSSLLGAREGSDGASGTVRIENKGDIYMFGSNSTASLKQTINGGGGNIEMFMDISSAAQIIDPDGVNVPEVLSIVEQATEYVAQLGASFYDTLSNLPNPFVSDISPIELNSTQLGDIISSGDNSIADLAQNIGGGGGVLTNDFVLDPNSEFVSTITLGAIETDNSAGGKINLERIGDVAVNGEGSRALNVQSIGGGGGTYISRIELSSESSITGSPGSKTASLVLGADPSVNNPGGDISANWTGDVSQLSDYLPVVSVQSIGAGGGDAYLEGYDNADIVLGATDGSDGDGGLISILNSGSIESNGYRSNGFVIQSIGGGGGSTYTDLQPDDVNVALSDWNAGSGSDISFSQIGDIILRGDESIGAVIQSLGGGGGLVDRVYLGSSGGLGNSGSISFDFNGSLTALGSDNIGFFVQSQSSSEQDDIDIEISSGSSLVMNETSTAIQLSGGASNQISNSGIIYTSSSTGRPDGKAFVGSDGDDYVVNLPQSSFTGNIDLGDGLNRVLVSNGASGFLGQQIFVGDGTFFNDGFVYPGADYIYDVNLSGDYIQSEFGSLLINLDYTDDSLDKLSITGDAVLNGRLGVSLRGIDNVKPGQRNLVFASTDGEIKQQNLELDIYPSIVARYDIGNTLNTAFLDVDIDFAVFGDLNKNQTRIGEYVNRIQLAGSDSSLSDFIVDIFGLTSVSQVESLYNSVSSEAFTSAPQTVAKGATRFVENMFSCQVADGPNKFISEGQCGWIDATGFTFSRDSTYENFGYYTTSYGLNGGAQLDLGNDYYLGVSFGQSRSNTNYSTVSAKIRGITNQAGLAIKKVVGATKFALGFGGGLTKSRVERNNVFPDTTARSNQTLTHIASTFRIAHDLDFGDWYLRPSLDLGLTQVWMSRFKESGAGALNLYTDAFENTDVTITPMLEVGGQMLTGGTIFRPSLAIGYSQSLTGSDIDVRSRFAGAPSGSGSFKTVDYADSGAIQVGANFDVIFENGVTLNLGYNGGFSRNSELHGGMVKVSVPF